MFNNSAIVNDPICATTWIEVGLPTTANIANTTTTTNNDDGGDGSDGDEDVDGSKTKIDNADADDRDN